MIEYGNNSSEKKFMIVTNMGEILRTDNLTKWCKEYSVCKNPLLVNFNKNKVSKLRERDIWDRLNHCWITEYFWVKSKTGIYYRILDKYHSAQK